LLDGQQRLTSLYQTCVRKHVVETITSRQTLEKRWFYIDMQKAMRLDVDREDAIFAVPEDRKMTSAARSSSISRSPKQSTRN